MAENDSTFASELAQLRNILAGGTGFEERARTAAEVLTGLQLLHEMEVKGLRHDLKNVAQVAALIAWQVRRETEDPEEFSKEFGRRLKSMASPELPGSRLVEDMLRTALNPYVSGDNWGRVHLHGRSAEVSGRAAFVLAEAGREMARNAYKHGALRPESLGQLRVVWTLENGSSGQALDLRWTEECPEPLAVIARKGEGLQLLMSDLRNMGVESSINPTQHGMDIQLRMLRAPTGLRILILDDDPSVGYGLACVFALAGYEVTVKETVEDALASIDTSGPDAAVLDFQLGKDDCREVALKLQDLSVPYLVLSGGEANADTKLPDGPPWLTKPVSPESLVDTVRELLR